MIIITDANGNLVKNIPEKVYQGSNKANSIVFVAPLSASNTTTITYKLANKELSQPFLMTPYNELPAGYEGFNAWLIDLETYVTQYFGTVEFQIKSYSNASFIDDKLVVHEDSNIVASVGSSFEVAKGVNVDIAEPSTDIYNQIITALADLRSELVNGYFVSKGILPYDSNYKYPLGVAVQESGKIYVSLIANNLGNPLDNPNFWFVYDYATLADITSAIYEHNQNNQSHLDIRQSIGIVNSNIATQIANHNVSPNSHEDIREEIDNIKDGTTIVEKASKDSEGNEIVSYYQEKKPNGTTNLIGEDGKLAAPYIPQSISGGLTYGGTFNAQGIISATTNATELNGTNITNITFADYVNFFFVSSETYTILGVEYTPGDWAICNGTGFDKIDSVQLVISVNGKIGVVNLTSQDVGALPNDTVYVVSINGQSGAVTITPQSIGATTEEYVDNKVDDYVGFIDTVGFNGTLADNTITFELDESQADFEFVNNKRYVIDCRLALTTLTGDLDNNYDIVFKDKNGNTINLNCIFQTNTNDTATVGDMCQIQNYNIAVGYSWRFDVNYIEFVENSTTTRVFYTDSITRETNPSMTGESLFNAIVNSKLKVGTTVVVTSDYTFEGTTYLQGNTYLVTGEWVDGELILGTEDITPKIDFDYVELDVPATATQGTITQEQLNILQANDNNYIIFDHEIYKLNGKGHIEGYLTYTCIERETGVTTVKTITITTSMLSWVLNSVDIPTNVANKVTNAIANDLAALDVNGNLIDSGVSKNNLYNPNLLINGDFRVNQRGESEYVDAGYTVDRWYKNGQSRLTVNADKSITFTRTTATISRYILQLVEDYEHLLGKTITISAKVKNVGAGVPYQIGIYNGTEYVLVTGNYSGGEEIIKATVVVPSSWTKMGVILYPNEQAVANTSVTIEYIKAEIGEIATPFIPRLYAEELELCQRYYLNFTDYLVCVGFAWGNTASSASIFIPTPIQLRTTPTINLDWGTFAFRDNIRFDIASLAPFTPSANGLRIRVTATTNYSADGQTIKILAQGTIDAEIYF